MGEKNNSQPDADAVLKRLLNTPPPKKEKAKKPKTKPAK